MLMSKLTKSLSELDAMADELLNKSEHTSPIEEKTDLKKSAKSEDGAEDLKPEDVSENVPDDEVKNTDESKDEGEENKEEVVEKSLDSKNVGDDDDEDDDEGETKEDLEKSLQSAFESNEEIKKSIDASEFLSAVTEVITKSLADVVYNLQGSSQQNLNSSDILAKSLQASLGLNKAMSAELDLVKSQNEDLRKSVQQGFDDIRSFISDQFEEFSHQPATMRKSVSNVAVHDRNFQKSLGGTQMGNLSKSEVLAKLNGYMYSGNPLVTPNDIISYESGAPLRAEVAQLIYNNM